MEMNNVGGEQRMHTGTRSDPYEITVAIGAGGMGEMFRARGTRLTRDVASKVWPRLNRR
jgi:hypothetical protein